MEPVEINAGSYYLRPFRADDLMDDRPALLAAYRDPTTLRWVPDPGITDLASAGEYVALRRRQWLRDERCSWAVADPVSGEVLGEVLLKDLDLAAGCAEAGCWTHPEHRGKNVAVRGLAAALRFGTGALGLHRIEYRFGDGNESSRRVAQKCGFAYHRRTPAGDHVWLLTAS